MPLELNGGPEEASQQLIRWLRERGMLPEERSAAHVPDLRVPVVSLTIEIAKTKQDAVP